VGAGGTILHYDGDSWSAMISGTPNDLRDVWGSGSSWSSPTSGTTSTQLNGVWGNAYNDVFDVFVVGASGSIRHYNGSAWSSMIGDYPLYEWKDNHSGETLKYNTDYPLGNTTAYGSSSLDEWAYGAWSVIVVYTSPETKGHQLYMYDTFRYMDHYGANQTPAGTESNPKPMNLTIPNFLAPQDVLYDASAARMTCFVGEGDWIYPNPTYPQPDQILVKLHQLTDPPGFPPVNSSTNVWNSRSNVMSPSPDGIDIDTFYAGNGIIQPSDDSALVSLKTGTDSWNLIYIILSFRSDISTGGISSIKVT
jgi:hypothetical protein